MPRPRNGDTEICVVRVPPQQFTTTAGTLRRCPGSLLSQLFTNPFPLYDEDTGAHHLPATLCDATSFAHILDYLRSGSWAPISDPAEHRRLADAIARLTIDSAPLLRRGTGEGRTRVHHLRVAVPLPDAGCGPSSAANSCVMLAGLAYRGYCVVDEVATPEGAARATEVVLRRTVLPLPTLKGLSASSQWLSLLYENA